ncbi:MAG: HAD-IA family hydrolase [Burkholderiales bacterium]|nr:HAD-IA family hydrolase [Burkholderiales bacterium]
MSRLRALLWDVDGTLAETERDGHRVAFNQAFESLALPWRWDEARYGELLRITGGRERLLHDMTTRGDAPPTAGEREALARELHAVKNRRYGELVREARLPLRGGVRELIDDAEDAGLRLAIATTTSRVNVDALMTVHFGQRWQQRFAAVVCGEDVQAKKPDPEVYRLTLKALGLPAQETVAIEDSPGGVAAACAAEIPVVVPLSVYFRDATIEGAVAIGPGLDERRGWRPGLAGAAAGRVTLADIEGWCAARESVSQFG